MIYAFSISTVQGTDTMPLFYHLQEQFTHRLYLKHFPKLLQKHISDVLIKKINRVLEGEHTSNADGYET